MGNELNDEEFGQRQKELVGTERTVGRVKEIPMAVPTDDEVSLAILSKILWSGRAKILACSLIFAFTALAYAFLAAEWYRAEVLLAPVDPKGSASFGAELAGLAALAGVNVSDGDSTEAVATLQSRDFARAFIEDLLLLPVLFADEWDPKNQRWSSNDAEAWPDSRDAVKYFHERVLTVSQDRQSGLVTLAVDWVDPDVAARWAETLVKRLNATMRERALHEAERNVAYLQGELKQTNLVALEQAIGRMLEGEMQKLMLARGNEEFAFRIVDAAEVPKEHVRPRRVLIAILGAILGGIIGVAWVLIVRVRAIIPQ